MKLAPRELDHLVLSQAGSVAQKRLARGKKLNYPEAVALIAHVVMERARDGDATVAELMDSSRRMLGTFRFFTSCAVPLCSLVDGVHCAVTVSAWHLCR